MSTEKLCHKCDLFYSGDCPTHDLSISHEIYPLAQRIKKIHVGIIGGREVKDYDFVKSKCDVIINKIKALFINAKIVIVSGGAKGADKLGERYAEERKIETIIYLPDWKKYGKSAGFIRNTLIAEKSNVIIAFPEIKSDETLSRGTMDTIKKMKKLDKIVKCFPVAVI